MQSDFLVIGAGIAGAAASYYLAEFGRVVLLEREDAPGYHSTGRSAALFTESYGNGTIRRLSVASGNFYRAPPPDFSDHPLLSPRGQLFIAPRGSAEAFAHELQEGRRDAPRLREVSPEEALRICPILRRDWLVQAAYEPDAQDMDVHAIHQGFLRGFRAQGGTLVTSAETTGIKRSAGNWRVSTLAGEFSAPILVDAAGAWADEVAELAGVRPVGLSPRRRTACLIDPPEGHDASRWPMVIDIEERFYFKPESGRLLLSPADETPMPPCDVQPDEMDIAVAVDRAMEAADLNVRHIRRSWAGLRSFVADRSPVAGPAPDAPGFIWLAGQGGYGIMTAPAMGRIAANFAAGRPLPDDLAASGLQAADLLPDRLF